MTLYRDAIEDTDSDNGNRETIFHALAGNAPDLLHEAEAARGERR